MCLEKRSNLLKEICRRLRYKPIIKTSDGNYTRVTGVYFDDSGSPWFKLIGSDNWYTFSVIDKIVLYSKNLINNSSLVFVVITIHKKLNKNLGI